MLTAFLIRPSCSMRCQLYGRWDSVHPSLREVAYRSPPYSVKLPRLTSQDLQKHLSLFVIYGHNKSIFKWSFRTSYQKFRWTLSQMFVHRCSIFCLWEKKLNIWKFNSLWKQRGYVLEVILLSVPYPYFFLLYVCDNFCISGADRIRNRTSGQMYNFYYVIKKVWLSTLKKPLYLWI